MKLETHEGRFTARAPIPVFEKPETSSIIFILSAALIINAGILFVLPPILTEYLSPGYNVEFVDLYDHIANNLAQGNGYRIEADMSETMVREPGYPLFLAMVFKIGGYRIEAARLANFVLVVGIAIMIMRLARIVTGDSVAALSTTLLFLLNPGTLVSESRGGIEIAFVFVLMVCMLALQNAVEKGNLWRFFLTGSTFGVAALVRSTVLAFPLFLFVYMVLSAKGAIRRLSSALRIAVLALGMTIVMSPWVIRNYLLVHKFVPTATVQGIAAQEGQYTCKHFSFDETFYDLQREAVGERLELARQLGIPFKDTYYQVFYDPRDEAAFNKVLLQRTAMEYRRDKTLLPRCMAQNLFFNYWFLGKTSRVTKLNLMIQTPLLILALVGAYILWKRSLLRRMGILLTFIVFVPLVHAPIVAHARHSQVVLPFLMILAGVPLAWVWRVYSMRAPEAAGCSL